MNKHIEYIVVRVEIEHPDDVSATVAVDEIVQEMEYSFSYNKNGLKIMGTQIWDNFATEPKS